MQSIVKTFATLTLFLSLSAIASASEWFDKVYVRYEPEQTFKRISEYFTGKEAQGNRMVVRLPVESREGMYWVIRLNQSTAQLPTGAQLKVSFYREGSITPESRTYPLDTERSVYTIFAGITGNDWPDKEAKPSAWKLELIDASGKAISSKKSFLWEYPKAE